MKRCSGPCDQGRRECPAPLACEERDPDDWGGSAPLMVVAGVLLAVCSYFVWGILS